MSVHIQKPVPRILNLNFEHSDFFNVDGNYPPRGSGAEDREFAPVEATGNLYRCRKLVCLFK